MINENIVERSGNVLLVKPNLVNVNQEFINGIPQYQNMYIFAELTAQSKGRTVITKTDTTTTSSKKINFIGNNQNKNSDNPNNLNFTTNYYDGSNPDGEYYEGFGIKSIKISINSSFVPQVAIQFIDIRGLAFFNQKDSPYRILFDFPPPTFNLTVKGHYGKPISYKLHLVNYTSEFNSSNGNFIIDANFIGMTFAPLSDILFRYIVNAPLIENRESMSPKPNEKPRNTFDLILKLKSLYKSISTELETDAENIKYGLLLEEIKKIDRVYELLTYYSKNEVLTQAGKPYLVWKAPYQNDELYMFPKTNSIPDDELNSIENISEFDTIIAAQQSSGYAAQIKNKLYFVYVAGTNIEVSDNTEITEFAIPIFFEFPTENFKTFDDALNLFKKQLLSEPISGIENNDIANPSSFLNTTDIQAKNSDNVSISSSGIVKYYGLDISKYYYKIYQKKGELEKERNQLATNIATKINNMVASELGMIPSIYNIFEIILNDVDTFFNILKTTSKNAYEFHNNDSDKKIILGDSSYVENKNAEIYPFPLVINKLENREERVAPIELNKKIQFPEIDLVNNFIDTFLDQRNITKEFDMRDNQLDDGKNKWIPISPFDSTLGGASPQSPYIGITDAIREETLKILMKRFYMLTQGTLPESFYSSEDDKKKKIVVSDAYVELYANAEAINLVQAVVSEKNRDLIDNMVNEYSNSKLEKFYSDIKKIDFTYDDGTTNKTGNIYSFPNNDPKYFSINPLSSGVGKGNVYIDKNDPNFTGVFLIGDVRLQDITSESSNPVDNFISNTKNGKLFSFKNPAEHYFNFTKENLLFISDTGKYSKNFEITDDGIQTTMRTRYIVNALNGNYIPDPVNNSNTKSNYFPGNKDQTDAERQEIAFSEGNLSFNNNGKFRNDSAKGYIDSGKPITLHWSSILAEFDDILLPTLNDTVLGPLLLLSNFGYSISPFNINGNGLNFTVFKTPAAIEIPDFYAPYIGALVSAIENDDVNKIKDYFITGDGRFLPNRGFYLLADLHDVENYLSDNDKRIFKNEYDIYFQKHADIVSSIGDLYGDVEENLDIQLNIQINRREYLYDYFLNPTSKGNKEVKARESSYYDPILKNFINRRNMLNYSEITFQMPESNNTGYISLEESNKNFKTKNDKYFTVLFEKVKSIIKEKKIVLKEEKKELEKSKGDVDIINQLYYSFKNINDKWLTGSSNELTGFPFNGKHKRLIDLFAFVDRGMNPIGENIINGECLGEMLNDPNVSLFSVLTQLLSLNGFEFFPLQNFLSFEDANSWKESFEIYNGSIDSDEDTYFVCMYLGGSSSYPSVSGNGFENDGIINILDPQLSGFEENNSGSQYEENIKQEDKDFPFREVRAFSIRFGEQNQSMFKDIKIDSKEYPETNESIQILSRLAGDNNPNAGVPKGQNLYNLYENRSYKATITGLGNVTIQPTQYFQLENVPLFNGAYVILNVEHNISENRMTTSFSGTKLLKYPMPRVMTPVAFMNFDGNSPGDVAKNAYSIGTQARFMTPERVGNSKKDGGLDSVYGVDVSHHNGVADWKKAKADRIDFAVIKLTEGDNFYSGTKYDIGKQINGAIDNGIDVTYYHFAKFGRTADPNADGIADANYFMSKINLFNKPKIAVLDLEEQCFYTGNKYKWTDKKDSITEYVQAFINTMSSNKIETILYTRTSLINSYGLAGFTKQPIWLAQYTNNAEMIEPTIPKGWVDWDMWQFSSQGMADGVPPAISNGVRGIDLNVMRKSFYKKWF